MFEHIVSVDEAIAEVARTLNSLTRTFEVERAVAVLDTITSVSVQELDDRTLRELRRTLVRWFRGSAFSLMEILAPHAAQALVWDG